MTDPKQSEGRENNAASPVEDWEASGLLETGKKPGEEKSFKRDVGGGQHGNMEEAKMMQEGGMADPEEAKPQNSTYPS